MTTLSASTRAGSSAEDALWAPSRKLTLAQARRRSDVIRILRMLFTYGVAASIGLLGGYLLNSALDGSSGRRAFKGEEIVTMLNPRFTGRDAAGDAYVITADSAQRRRADPNLIDLRNPRLVDEKGTQVEAPEGTFDQGAQVLELFRDVRVIEPSGYVFNTTHARVFVTEGRVVGVEPLQGQGPLGDIRSDTYTITEGGDVMNFDGNVEMTFYEDEPAPEPQEDPPHDN